MVGEVFAGLTAFRTILDGAKALAQMHDESVRLQASIDLQRQIFAAQQDYSTLLERVRTLEAEVTAFEKWDTEKERYELKTIGHGCVAYMLKSVERGSEPPHWLCPNCYTHAQKGYFQAAGTMSARKTT